MIYLNLGGGGGGVSSKNSTTRTGLRSWKHRRPAARLTYIWVGEGRGVIDLYLNAYVAEIRFCEISKEMSSLYFGQNTKSQKYKDDISLLKSQYLSSDIND